VYFEKAGRNRWQAHVYVDDDQSTANLRFDQDGNLRGSGGGALRQGQADQPPSQALVDLTYRPGRGDNRLAGGAGQEQFTLDLSRVTQYDSNYGTNYASQELAAMAWSTRYTPMVSGLPLVKLFSLILLTHKG